MVHLKKFLRITNTVKNPLNDPDYIILATFPFSLEGRVEDWLSNLPRWSITSWDQCSLAFLMKLFLVEKSKQLI